MSTETELPMTYFLTLTDEEMASLGWVANRYESALVLYDALLAVGPEDGPETRYGLTEPEAWEYAMALEAEDGDQSVPPCVGGTLETKLLALSDEIV